MVFRKILAILIGAMVFCTSMTASAYAETTSLSINIGVSPLYEIAKNVKSNLSISGTTAYCTSSASGTDAVSITVKQTLQKQGFLWSWPGVKDANWEKTVNSNTISFSNTKSGLESGKYRLKSVFTLTDKNGKTETITVYSAEKTVG